MVDASTAARAALELAAAGHRPTVDVTHDGRVESTVDGIATLSGLGQVGLGSLLQLPTSRALVLGLREHAVTAALLDWDPAAPPKVGDRAHQSLSQLAVVVDDSAIGRVLDPLGAPADNGPPLVHGQQMLLERRAPQIFERAHVRRPLSTGVLAVDALFPIGCGQRELIAGDEGTGKTSLAVDAMLAQANTGVVCVYAAIGQRRSETWRIYELLSKHRVEFVIVSAPEDNSPALRHLAAYTATSIGEYFRDRGRHALVVYDDLSAHAIAWRELSLLLQRPPGREAYPGDVFYLHSRLLERSAQLSDALGGGSLTALPICSLESGRLTAYIPTNLISITDGQLVMNSELFASGQRPAIDAGMSVSRVGAHAQSKVLAAYSAQLKLEYSSFLELEAFARLGTRLQSEAQRRIDLGRRLRALLLARQGAPLGLLDELVSLSLASQSNLVLDLEVHEVRAIASGIALALRHEHPALEGDLAAAATTTSELDGLVQTELLKTHARRIARG